MAKHRSWKALALGVTIFVAVLGAAWSIYWMFEPGHWLRGVASSANIGALGILVVLALSLSELMEHLRDDKVSEHMRSTADSIKLISQSNRLVEQHREILEGPHPSLFGGLARDRMTQLQDELAEMTSSRPRYTIRAVDPAEQYVDQFVKVMQQHIDEGSEFNVISNTKVIWSDDYFLRPGNRYLRANKLAAVERDVRIKRLFIINASELREERGIDRVTGILMQHKRVMSAKITPAESAKREHGQRRKHGSRGKHNEPQMRVIVMRNEDRYRGHFSAGGNFAITRSDRLPICIQVQYAPNPKLHNGVKDQREHLEWKITGFLIATDSNVVNEKRVTFGLLWDEAQAGEFMNAGKTKLADESALKKFLQDALCSDSGRESTNPNPPPAPSPEKATPAEESDS